MTDSTAHTRITEHLPRKLTFATPLWAVLPAVGLVIAVGILSALWPTLGVTIVVGPPLLYFLLRRPQYLLALVIVTSLARELPGAGAVSVGATVLSFVALLLQGRLSLTPALAVASGLAGYLAFRVGFVAQTPGESDAIIPVWLILLGNASLVIVAGSLGTSDRTSTYRAVGTVGLAYVLGIFSLSLMVPGRIEGFTGNPNRLVLALVILTPFALHLFEGKRWQFVAQGAVIATVVYLTLRTSSVQGLIAVPVTLALTLVAMHWTPRQGQSRHLFPRIALAIAVGGLSFLWLLSFLRSDFLAKVPTLSGRTAAFQGSWDAFVGRPLLGTGLRVLEVGVEDMAPHNTYLGILYTSGIVGGVLGALVVVALLRRISVALRAQDAVLGAVFGVLLESTVQSIEAVPAVWAVIALMLARDRGLSGERRSKEIPQAPPTPISTVTCTFAASSRRGEVNVNGVSLYTAPLLSSGQGRSADFGDHGATPRQLKENTAWN